MILTEPKEYVEYVCVTCGGELHTCDDYGYCRKCMDYAYNEDGYAYPMREEDEHEQDV